MASVTTLPTEIRPMLIVDCPMCDGPAVVGPTDDLACEACAITFELAPEEEPALPAAA